MRATDPAVLQRIRAELATEPGEPTAARIADAVRRAGLVLGDAAMLEVVDAIRAELVGAGPLQALLRDPQVTDVLVNGERGVWVDRGRGVERVRVELGGEQAIRALAVRLAATAGRRLDDASPFVDGQLPGGIRLHVALPPLVESGTHISLRVPARRSLTLTDLVEQGTVPGDWADVLARLITQRHAFVVTGGTGAGKTTILGALLALVPPAERIVVVEDCAELSVAHPHLVRLQSRTPNVEGRGAITMTDLVRQALRMRPDRLVVGEVRGAEVRELLTALNTGHEGGCGTLHANDLTDVPARFEALGALAGLGRDAVHAQVAGAVKVVLHLRRFGAVRRLVGIGAVERRPDRIRVLPALRSTGDAATGWTGDSAGCELLRRWGLL